MNENGLLLVGVGVLAAVVLWRLHQQGLVRQFPDPLAGIAGAFGNGMGGFTVPLADGGVVYTTATSGPIYAPGPGGHGPQYL